jgi:hypothetical protein
MKTGLINRLSLQYSWHDPAQIFPDKQNPGDVTNHAVVLVTATLNVMTNNIPVYFTAFDVRDSTHVMPLFGVTDTTLDNVGSPRQGTLAGWMGLTDQYGIVRTNFTVTMQPGDNFRVVASCDPNFASNYHADPNSTTGAIIDNNGDPIGANYVTPMLTVWRRLHVEVDSMANVVGNSVNGNITGISGTASVGATQVVVSVNLRTGLTPRDDSPNLSDATPANGRFENGQVTIGSSTTTDLLGNGNDFLETKSGQRFMIPFAITACTTCAVVSGHIVAYSRAITIGDSVYTVSANLTPHAFDGGTLAVAGQNFNVVSNGVNTVNILQIGELPFSNLHDDDLDNRLPYSNPSLSWLTTVMADAYVQVVNDGGGNINNNKATVPFVLNVEDLTLLYATIPSSAGAFESRPNRANDFWVVWLCSAYQPFTTPEAGYLDPGDVRADSDPNSESPLIAITTLPDWTLPPGGALLFMETFYDRGTNAYGTAANILEPQLIAHELGHTFGLDHTYGGIMGNFWVPGVRFAPADLVNIRKKVTSPGVP